MLTERALSDLTPPLEPLIRLLVGVETRSSGPVRLPRDEQSRRARGFANLFPVGEGAGHAGGIMSAAIDGARSAQALLELGIAR